MRRAGRTGNPLWLPWGKAGTSTDVRMSLRTSLRLASPSGMQAARWVAAHAPCRTNRQPSVVAVGKTRDFGEHAPRRVNRQDFGLPWGKTGREVGAISGLLKFTL